MDFARLWEQAREFWARPTGKWIIGGVTVLLVTLVTISYFAARPRWSDLGTFDAETAPKVAQKLIEAKIQFQQESGKNYSFKVQEKDYNAARLQTAQVPGVDGPGGWNFPSWRTTTSWMDTEVDKRLLWVDQTQESLTRAIQTLSAVERARVQITVPMKEALFKEQETPPKASVFIQSKKGTELTPAIVRSIMQAVAASVDRLDPKSVTVTDTIKSRVVSDELFQQEKSAQTGDVSTDQLSIIKTVRESLQQQLSQLLVGPLGDGNFSVMVNPVINWQRAQSEATTYQANGLDGKGIIVSEQTESDNANGVLTPGNGGLTGTTPNTNPPGSGVPTYPTQTTGNGPSNQEKTRRITNYLVNQVKTLTANPGGAMEELSVGVFVNATAKDGTIPPATEQKIKNVVTTAMGSKARVEVTALPFLAGNPFDLPKTPPIVPGLSPTLVIALVALLTLLGIVAIGFWFARRGQRDLLQPAFSGPEGALLAGIPVGDMDLTPMDSYGELDRDFQKRIPASVDDLSELPLEELTQLGAEFLEKLGIDPAKIRMMERVEKIAKANPEAVATLVKAWMSDL